MAPISRLNLDSFGRIRIGPSTQYPRVRLMIADDTRAVVWRQVGSDLERVADVGVKEWEKKGTRLYLTTTEGDEWAFRESGCGCGRAGLKQLRREEAFA